MELGNKFSYWKYANDKSKDNVAVYAIEAYSEYCKKYFATSRTVN